MQNNPTDSDSIDTQDDAVLVKRAQTADRVAFDELIRRYQGKIYGLIYNMTSNNADTEDLVQEVFIKAYKSLGRFKGKARFYTWLYRIGVNQTLNFLKKRQRRSALSLDDIDLGIERDPAYIELTESKPSPLRNTSISELQERLNKALQTLSEKHRTVVVLHDIQGLPHDEVAKMLKTSSGTVRSRLFYARQKLQAELAEFRR